MAQSDMINLLKRIVSKQGELLDSFDQWVRKVKENDLEEASEIVKRSNAMRLEVTELKKQYDKLSKKSGIILLN